MRNNEGHRWTFPVKYVTRIKGYQARQSMNWSDEETDSPSNARIILKNRLIVISVRSLCVFLYCISQCKCSMYLVIFFNYYITANSARYVCHSFQPIITVNHIFKFKSQRKCT